MKRTLLTVACSMIWGLASWAQLPKADVLDIVFHDDGTNAQSPKDRIVDQRICFLTDDLLDDADAFASAGWRVFHMGVDIDAVAEMFEVNR